MENDFDSVSAGDAKGQVAPGWNIPCNEALGDKSHQSLEWEHAQDMPGGKEADPDLFDVLMEQEQYPALISWELLGNITKTRYSHSH